MKWIKSFVLIALLNVFSLGIVNAENSLWAYINLGESKVDFSLNKDGSVNYFGRKIAQFTNIEGITVSPKSEKNGYITVFAGKDLFLLDSKTKKIIAKNPSEEFLVFYDNKIYWSPNESYALVAAGREGVEVAVIDIKTSLIKGIKFEDLSKNYKGNIRELQVANIEKASWITDSKFAVPVEICCNPNDDNECTVDKRTGRLIPRRIYKATVDLTNIKNIIYTVIKK